jgi:hypothetical protein
MKSRRIRWVGRVAHMGEARDLMIAGDHFEDLGVDIMILK